MVDRIRLLHHIAGCHARDINAAVHLAVIYPTMAAQRIANAVWSARLAWRVAIYLEAHS